MLVRLGATPDPIPSACKIASCCARCPVRDFAATTIYVRSCWLSSRTFLRPSKDPSLCSLPLMITNHTSRCGTPIHSDPSPPPSPQVCGNRRGRPPASSSFFTVFLLLDSLFTRRGSPLGRRWTNTKLNIEYLVSRSLFSSSRPDTIPPPCCCCCCCCCCTLPQLPLSSCQSSICLVCRSTHL
jgi:hypothetical protein